MPDREISAVIFDLGGVLIDWDPRYLYRQLFTDPAEMERFLAEVCSPSWHNAHDLGEDVHESCRRLAGRHPEHAEIIMAWAERGEEMIGGQIDQTVDMLAALKAAGTACYALSNMEREAFADRQVRFPFLGWFDGLVISGLEGVAKPDRRIFELLLRRHRLDPAACVFIDDSAVNVAAARELGIVSVRYRSPDQLAGALRGLGLPL